MALAATTVWEVRTTGSDTLCSGGFVAGGGGTDYSQQAAAQYNAADLAIDAVTNTKVTSASHNFVAADVGNLIRITAGTGYTTGFYQIVSVASNAATLDRSPGAVGITGGTYYVGGALASPGLAVANLVAGHIIYATGSYTTTTNTVNIATGRLDFTTTGTQVAFCRFIGYTTTRTDGGKYTITLGAGLAGPAINTNNANSYNEIRNIALVGNATSGATAIIHNGRSNRIFNLKVSAFTGGGANIVSVGQNATMKDFEISGGNTNNSAALNCATSMISDGWVHGNAGRGVQVDSSIMTFNRVISAEHTGGNGYGWFHNGYDILFFECGAWNNAAGDYFLNGANPTATYTRCVSGGSGGYNWDNRSGPDAVALYYCAAKANTTALYPVTPNTNVGLVTLTGDPWTDRTNGDFSTNKTAGAGAALRGVSGIIFGLTTTYADIGPAQHQDPTGGTGPNVIVSAAGAGSRGGSW